MRSYTRSCGTLPGASGRGDPATAPRSVRGGHEAGRGKVQRTCTSAGQGGPVLDAVVVANHSIHPPSTSDARVIVRTVTQLAGISIYSSVVRERDTSFEAQRQADMLAGG